MKQILLRLCVSLAFAPLVTNAGDPPVPQPLPLAVFDFQSTEEGQRDLGTKVSSLVTAELSGDTRLNLVERMELDKALGEHELSLSGAVNPETAVQLGHLTGAKVLVTGRLIKADRESVVVAKVIGIETGRVFAAKETLPPNGALSEVAHKLAGDIADLATRNVSSLTAPSESHAEAVARIKASLAGPKRPAVSVHIPEQHFGSPVIDPAAETELSLILHECGFTVVDDKSNARPDFSIEGEAFSERGMQRGNLIACKARVELKLRNLATGDLVANDRQVSRAIDLSEHIAAKTALENAALQLAPRLLPKLAQ